ncbi:MAG: 4Fe-4S binding protein [Firmicutes bacterium]|nr:4Fe-4S binding protein [Bacillota bacterium]
MKAKVYPKALLMPFWLLLVFLFLLLFPPESALACELKIFPATFSVAAGETVNFRLERYQTHRQCVLPLEETVIKVTGGKVSDPGIWKRGTPDILIFQVKFTEPGQASVRVERNCPKSGLIFKEAKGVVTLREGDAAANGQLVKTDAASPEKKPLSSSSEKTPPFGTVEEKSQSPAPPPVAPQNSGAENTPAEEDTGGRETSAGRSMSNGSGTAGDSEENSYRESSPDKFPYAKNFILWGAFFLAGTFLYLFRQKGLRRPFLFVGLLTLGFYLGGCPEPMGAVYYFFSRKETMYGIAAFLLAVPVGLSLIWGRIFCGWVCPVGAVQELMYPSKKNAHLPEKIERGLKSLKYLLLLIIGYLSWHTGINLWGKYEPFKTLFGLEGEFLPLFLLGVTLFASLLIERPFCRYICPLGVILALTSRFSLYKLKARNERCVGCGLCAGAICPMGALVASRCSGAEPPQIDNAECIRCLRCTQTCRRGALEPTR